MWKDYTRIQPFYSAHTHYSSNFGLSFKTVIKK